MLSIISNSLMQNDDFSSVSQYLKILRENRLLNQKKSDLHDLISYTNSSLNSSKKRLQGVVLVNEFIDQCDNEIFQDCAATWSNLLISTLNSRDPCAVKEVCCLVTTCHLERLATFPDLSHDASSSFIPQLVPALLQAKPEWSSSAVKCLCLCLKLFHGPCGPFKKKIENFLINLLKDARINTSQVLGECYCLLAQAGGGGGQGVKHAESWNCQLCNVTNTLRFILEDLYSADPNANMKVPVSGDSFNLGEINDEEPSRTFTLQTHFSVMTNLVNCMLRTEFKTAVHVSVGDILDLVCSAFTLSVKQLMLNANHEKTLLSCVLPFIQKDALTILTSLITVCKSHLVVFNEVINKLILQVLNSTRSSENSSKLHSYRELRSQVYITIQTWLEYVGALSNISKISTQLITHIAEDIKPHKPVVKLSQQSEAVVSTAKHGKKKRKLAMNDFTKLSSTQQSDLGEDFKVTRHALQVLQLVVMKAGCLVSPEFHKTSQDVVLNAALKWQAERQPTAPYCDPVCRRILYHTLLQLVLHPHPSSSPPTHCALTIFHIATRDIDTEVARVSREALTLCQVVIHPRVPSFTSPPPVFNQHTVSQETLSRDEGNNELSGVEGNTELLGEEGNTELSGDEGNNELSGDEVNHLQLSCDEVSNEDVLEASMETETDSVIISCYSPSGKNQDVTSDMEELKTQESECDLTVADDITILIDSASDDDVVQMRSKPVKQEVSGNCAAKPDDDTKPVTSKTTASSEDKEAEEQGKVLDMLSSFVDVGPDSD